MTKSPFVLLLTFVGAAHANIWQTGDLTTYGQGSWGGNPGIDAGATLLVPSFNTVYAATSERSSARPAVSQWSSRTRAAS